MEGSLTELSKYRFETARSDLKVAKMLFEAKEFRSSVNRSYYSIFHALRSVLALDGFQFPYGPPHLIPANALYKRVCGFCFYIIFAHGHYLVKCPTPMATFSRVC